MKEWLRAIAQYKQNERQVEAGSQLFRPGEPCREMFQLVGGWAFLYTLFRDGRRQVLNFALPGTVLGFHLVQDAITTYGMEALTDIVVTPYNVTASHPEIGMPLAWLPVARPQACI